MPDEHGMTKGTGTCPTCHRRYTLKDNGTLRKHWARDGMGKALPFSNPCEGSGKRPFVIGSAAPGPSTTQ